MERFISKKISSDELSILDNNSEWLGIPKSHLMECAFKGKFEGSYFLWNGK